LEELDIKSVVEKCFVYASTTWGNQQIWSVSPSLEKAPEVFGAQFASMGLFQLGPLTVLMPDQRQCVVCDYAVTFIFELKTVVNVQVAVETERLPHQANLINRFSPEGHAVSLNSVGILLAHFFMKVS
jgi:hypothetical protein